MSNQVSLRIYRRRQIIEASCKVISRKGVGATRLKDIASEANISLGSMQYYFRHRDSMITETFETLLELALATWRHVSSTEPDPVKRLFALLRLQVFGCVPFNTRWSFWIEFWSAAKNDTTLQQYAQNVYTRWSEPFTQAIKEEIKENNFQLSQPINNVAIKLMALIDGLAVRVVMDHESVDEKTMFTLLVDAACLNLSISQNRRNTALETLPDIISMSYPLETHVINKIDWRPLETGSS